jgi:hypothetical protein
MFNNFAVTSKNELNINIIGADDSNKPSISASGMERAAHIFINGSAKIIGVSGRKLSSVTLTGSFNIEGEIFTCSDLTVRGTIDSSADLSINLIRGSFTNLANISKHFVTETSAVSLIDVDTKLDFMSNTVTSSVGSVSIAKISSLRIIANCCITINALEEIKNSILLYLHLYGNTTSLTFNEGCFENENWNNQLKVTHTATNVLSIHSPYNRAPLFASIPEKASNVIYNFTDIDPHPVPSSSTSVPSGSEGQNGGSISPFLRNIIIIVSSISLCVIVVIIIIIVVVKKRKHGFKSEDIRTDSLFESLLT